MERRVILKPGRDKALRQRHPWIFSGAIDRLPALENGEVLPVYSAEGEFLAQASFHATNSLSGRVLTFKKEPIEQAVTCRLCQAIAFRKSLFDPAVVNCYRLVNAEGDGLSGLIVDLYDDVAVIQVSTCGMQALLPLVVSVLQSQLSLRGIYEKSQSAARKQEGLLPSIGLLFGHCPEKLVVKENGILFSVDIVRGQKTGLFLDQRLMRHLVGTLAKGKSVLNCFAYTGGFSLFALKGGALHVTSVDLSEEAVLAARENTQLNQFSSHQHQVICEDVFTYLKEQDLPFEIVILDPPAFAKKRQDVKDACRGYKEINRIALQKMPPCSYLLTCSCSHFIDETLFQQVLFQAAVEAGREVTICSYHLQAPDHPISLFHPEGGYLKSLLLYVR